MWTEEPKALELLDRLGGPYETSGFRQACAEAVAGMEDVSFAARAADGTGAAIALISSGRTASSVPFGYGGVRASRPLNRAELQGFLAATHAASRVWGLSVAFLGDGDCGPGKQFGTVHFVELGTPASERWGKKTSQEIRRSVKLGCTCSTSDDPEPFLALYREASADWGVRYPEPLVRSAAERGIVRFYYIRDTVGEIVNATAALLAPTHWIYWFGAQNEAGRKFGASYLAVATMLGDAYEAGVDGVNLGASAGLPGVHWFKSRFAPVDRPICSLQVGSRLAIRAAGLSGRARARLRSGT